MNTEVNLSTGGYNLDAGGEIVPWCFRLYIAVKIIYAQRLQLKFF